VPMYWALFRAHSLTGLAIASDIGIVIQTASLTFLLHRKRLVSFAHLEFPELARALAAALIAFIATYGLAHALPAVTTHRGDFLILAAGSIAWLLSALAILTITGSKLPKQILRRK